MPICQIADQAARRELPDRTEKAVRVGGNELLGWITWRVTTSMLRNQTLTGAKALRSCTGFVGPLCPDHLLKEVRVFGQM